MSSRQHLHTNGLQTFAQGNLLNARNGQRQHQVDAAFQHAEGLEERRCLLGIAALDRRRIGNAPMRGSRTTRPYWASLRHRTVADGATRANL